MLQPLVSTPIETDGYPFPLLPGLVIEFLNLGHTVSLVTTGSDIDRVQKYYGERLTVVVVPSRARARHRALDLFAVERRGIRDALREIAPDVVHAHWTYEFTLGSQAARVAPVLVTAHDAPLTILRHLCDPYRAVRAVMAYLARVRVHRLTSVSPYLADKWRREMLYRGSIAIIPNPIPRLDVSRAHTPRRGATVLEVADASTRKNVKALVEAMVLVRRVRPDAELRLVGRGLEDGGPIHVWAKEGGIDDGVIFLGLLDRAEISAQYAQAAVFCHTSLEESQGLCLLEAMSMDVPVIAGRDSGGVAWTLFEGAAGSLIDVRHPEEISSAILSVLEDPTGAARNAEAAKLLIDSRFSPAVIAGQYLAEYKALIRPH
jgi:glycosyltransferase involved in cell wall biosynthesis